MPFDQVVYIWHGDLLPSWRRAYARLRDHLLTFHYDSETSDPFFFINITDATLSDLKDKEGWFERPHSFGIAHGFVYGSLGRPIYLAAETEALKGVWLHHLGKDGGKIPGAVQLENILLLWQSFNCVPTWRRTVARLSGGVLTFHRDDEPSEPFFYVNVRGASLSDLKLKKGWSSKPFSFTIAHGAVHGALGTPLLLAAETEETKQIWLRVLKEAGADIPGPVVLE
mmetsp:Transcript_30246/g.67774  ORF Transcript_30246/g.67774 Transcript_30246/m.67774 type:complete len:226 (+) Transcript_30246:132-809(+)